MVLLGSFWLLLGRFGPKMAPKMDPQMAPNRPQNHLKEGRCKLKTIKNVKLSLNLGLGFEMVQDSIKMILRWSKMAPRWSKRVPREPQDEASWAKMIQDYYKFAPTKPQNRPRWLKDVVRWSFGT